MIRNDLEALRLDSALEALAVARARRSLANSALLPFRDIATSGKREVRPETFDNLSYDEAVSRLEERAREHQRRLAKVEDARQLIERVRSLIVGDTLAGGDDHDERAPHPRVIPANGGPGKQ